MLNIFTDGSYCDELNFGAWGFYSPDNNICHTGVIQAKTSNEVELYAVLMAASYFADVDLFIYSDSLYVTNGGELQISEWQKQAWTTAKGKKIKDTLYWSELLRHMRGRSVNLIWTKAHTTKNENDFVDKQVKKLMNTYKLFIQGKLNGK